MDFNKFLHNKTQVRVASTIILMIVGVQFFLFGFFEFNLILEIFSLSSFSVYRFWNIVLGVATIFVGYAMYKQNKEAVDETLKKAREKVAYSASSVKNKVDEQLKPASESNESEVKAEVKVKKEV